MRGNFDPEEQHEPLAVLTFFSSVVLILTFLLNLIILGVFAKNPKLRTQSNLFIISLAVADIGVAVGVMPLR